MNSRCTWLDCETCEYHQGGLCRGCEEENARRKKGEDRCAIYDCTQAKGLASCADCGTSFCFLIGGMPFCPIGARFQADLEQKVHAKARAPLAPRLPRIPPPVRERLYLYVSYFECAAEMGQNRARSEEIGKVLGLQPATVRRDLACLGVGHRGTGYNVAAFRARLRESLGLDDPKPVAWAGAEKLWRNPDYLPSLASLGFRIAVLVDPSPHYQGMAIGDLTVEPVEKVRELIPRNKVQIAILSVGHPHVQKTAEALVDAGVTGILNFTCLPVQVPRYVFVRHSPPMKDFLVLSHMMLPRSADGSRAQEPDDR